MKVSGAGNFGTTTRGGFNDGEWKYILVLRSGNEARIEDEAGNLLVTVEYGKLWTLCWRLGPLLLTWVMDK